MRVSVIVPAWNAEEHLGAALGSVAAQGHPELEVIVIDDGSRDATAAVARRFGARCVTQEHAGPAAARNHGLAAACSELIAFLDADDLWPEGKLACQLSLLERDAALHLVVGRVQLVGPAGPSEPLSEPWHGCYLGAALIRRSAFELAGTFDQRMRLGEDLDWFLRAAERGLVIERHPEVALYYRRHGRNLTGPGGFDPATLVRSLKMSLDRRRMGGG
jgi:glycosyltransferase involved in cell wall biosynthesis